mgnify:FL=1
MSSDKTFRPDWVSPPGHTIAEVLASRKIAVAAFAEQLGWDIKRAQRLLDGKLKLTPDIAAALVHVVGSTERFWLAREQQYREILGIIESESESDDEAEWVRSLPVSDLAKFGWIKATTSKVRAKDCYRFFGVNNLNEWKQKYEEKILSVAFRTSVSFDPHPPAVAAWLRRGEVQIEKIPCAKWNPNAFRESLPEIRKLTLNKYASKFLPRLKEICARSGVAVVIVRAPTGCRASGVARFWGEKAAIQLSFRHKTDDHFWFSFFHEAGHLLLHPHMGMFLDGLVMERTKEEVEADEFAENALLTKQQREVLFSTPQTYLAVMRFAVRAGISPGIAVGQLQHAQQMDFSRLNKLKRSFEWD